ncbi:15-cis-phytoene synthase CrtB [Massilia sp. S19_KUP03_FR1]|uniref:15-cis-phytoene synthase CrtB n=1 Tax=Massilia sp. S19_KUP03_FR1 TaxID=3025503 RepID=UPI002FCD428C
MSQVGAEQLLAHATETIAVGSKSFAAAARLFDPSTRRGVLMLYAWCRHCDDVIDDQELGFNNAGTVEHDASAALAELQRDTARAYAGEPMTVPAFAAFQEVARNHHIAQRYALDHLAGFAMDVDDARYETLDDTLRYCYHVAGVVGLMMAQIMGAQDDAVLDRACDLGMAFQLTNIARDIVEDARVGRCYVPAQWLREAGVPAGVALAQLPDYLPALAQVAARLVAEAEPYYRSANGGIHALPLRSAWAIATAHGVYRQIGIDVRARGTHAWDQRVSTSKAAKLRLLALGGLQALASRIMKAPARPPGLWQRPGPGPVAGPGAAGATAL